MCRFWRSTALHHCVWDSCKQSYSITTEHLQFYKKCLCSIRFRHDRNTFNLSGIKYTLKNEENFVFFIGHKSRRFSAILQYTKKIKCSLTIPSGRKNITWFCSYSPERFACGFYFTEIGKVLSIIQNECITE